MGTKEVRGDRKCIERSEFLLTAFLDSLHNLLRDSLIDGLDCIFGALDGALGFAENAGGAEETQLSGGGLTEHCGGCETRRLRCGLFR